MTKPNPSIRDLLARAKRADGPPRGTEMRIHRSLMGAATASSTTIGVTAAEASLASAAATSGRFAVLATGKLGLLTSVMVGMVSGTLLLSAVEHVARNRTSIQATVAARAEPRQRSLATATAAPTAPLGVSLRAQPPATVSAKSATPAVAPSSPSIAEETRLLARVQQALREGAGQNALDLLARYRRDFPRGALGEEALASEVFAHCLVGNGSAAAEARIRFRQRFAGSPLEPRVEMSCANNTNSER